MVIATSNRLLPLLAGAVVLMLAFVTLKSCNEEQEASLVMETVPQAPAPDADSPADTIKTLTANVAAMTTGVQALRKDNDQLRKGNRDLLANRHQIEENVTTRVKRDLRSREKDQAARNRIHWMSSKPIQPHQVQTDCCVVWVSLPAGHWHRLMKRPASSHRH